MITFAPYSRAGDFEMITPYELWELLHRLDYGPSGSAQSEAEKVSCTRMKERLQAGLANGELNSFVTLDGDSKFYRIPSEHRRRANPLLEGEIADTLFCWSMSEVPSKFHDAPIFIFRDDADAWIAASPPLAFDRGAWISSLEARKLVADGLGQLPPWSETLLLQRAGAGLLPIKAKRMIYRGNADGPFDDYIFTDELSSAIAKSGILNITTGRLSAQSLTVGSQYFGQLEAYDVMFGRASIMELVDNSTHSLGVTKPVAASTRPKPGPDSNAHWPEAVAAAIAFVNEEMFSFPLKHGQKQKIIDVMLARMMDFDLDFTAAAAAKHFKDVKKHFETTR